jgi:hypothetical protein
MNRPERAKSLDYLEGRGLANNVIGRIIVFVRNIYIYFISPNLFN